MFNAYVSEQIGWYVYALRNPLTGFIFYVGKGKGNRVFQHAIDALESPVLETEKLEEIRAIIRAGKQVETFVIRHGIETEEFAYEVEAAVLDAMHLSGQPVTNIAGGHGHRDAASCIRVSWRAFTRLQMLLPSRTRRS